MSSRIARSARRSRTYRSRLDWESVECIQGTWTKFWPRQMLVHIGVFNNEVVAGMNERSVGNDLVVDEWSSMIRIHHGAVSSDRAVSFRDKGRAALEPVRYVIRGCPWRFGVVWISIVITRS